MDAQHGPSQDAPPLGWGSGGAARVCALDLPPAGARPPPPVATRRDRLRPPRGSPECGAAIRYELVLLRHHPAARDRASCSSRSCGWRRWPSSRRRSGRRLAATCTGGRTSRRSATSSTSSPATPHGLIVTLDRTAVRPIFASLRHRQPRHHPRGDRRHARRLRRVALQGRQQPAALGAAAAAVPAARGDDPGDDHVGLSRHHRHLVGAVADLRHRHAALLLLADEDLLRRGADRDRGGGAGRGLLALPHLPAR